MLFLFILCQHADGGSGSGVDSGDTGIEGLHCCATLTGSWHLQCHGVFMGRADSVDSLDCGGESASSLARGTSDMRSAVCHLSMTKLLRRPVLLMYAACCGGRAQQHRAQHGGQPEFCRVTASGDPGSAPLRHGDTRSSVRLRWRAAASHSSVRLVLRNETPTSRFEDEGTDMHRSLRNRRTGYC